MFAYSIVILKAVETNLGNGFNDSGWNFLFISCAAGCITSDRYCVYVTVYNN